jgi:hypothetical protein
MRPQTATLKVKKMIRLPHSATFLQAPLHGLARLQRIKTWMKAHKKSHRVEYEAFDTVLTVWLMGLVGALPVIVLQKWWILPICSMAAFAPSMYIARRLKQHAQGKLRCDWAHVL